MKVSELYEAVAKLGFEDSLEDGKAFYYALNRAVGQINSLRPRIATYDILHKPLANRVSESDHEPREVLMNIEYVAEGAKGYYFEALGEGNYKVEYLDGDVYKEVARASFSYDKFTPVRGIVEAEEGGYPQGAVKLTFYGEYVSYVRSVALYDVLLSADAKKVPAFSEFCSYDVSELCKDDFLKLSENPVELNGYRIMNKDYRIEDKRIILLPRDNPGIYRIRYERRVRKIEYSDDPINDDTEIDLDEDLCLILPLLVSSFIWIDDEPEKAQYYLNLYLERSREIAVRDRIISPVNYETNGW